MIKLYIDFDGVILDTITKTNNELVYLNLKTEEEINKYFIDVDWADLIDNSPEINESINCIKKLIVSGVYDTHILTHVNSIKEIREKDRFFNENFINLDVIYVPRSQQKHCFVDPNGAVLVDDYLPNCINWQENGGIGIKFSNTNKDCPIIKITKLDQLLELYNTIALLISSNNIKKKKKV